MEYKEQKTIKDYENDRDRIKSLERKYDSDSRDFEDYIYERRQRLDIMMSSFRPDNRLNEIYENRRQLYKKMELNLVDCMDEYNAYFREKNKQIDADIEELRRVEQAKNGEDGNNG